LLERKGNDVEMVLMEKATGIPLDLIILIRSFVYEKLTDENFLAAVELWFGDEEIVDSSSVTLVTGIPQESRI
jgi:hypothetical protein